MKFQAWLTLGKLDPERWQPLTDARWTRSGGTLRAEGGSQGFGNRSLCLQKADMPNLPCELSVREKLENESGAAGLVFCSDGKDKHYGFYPSGGGLRLTRFDGPDVYSWKILAQAPSPAYRAGDWNWLSVRVDKERIICRVNDTVVFDEPDTTLRGGRAGVHRDCNNISSHFGGGQDQVVHPFIGRRIEGDFNPLVRAIHGCVAVL